MWHLRNLLETKPSKKHNNWFDTLDEIEKVESLLTDVQDKIANNLESADNNAESETVKS